MSSIQNALGWSFFSNYLNLIVRFGAVVIVARLLTPDEIGIFSIALAGFGFLQIFRDFGIGQYIIQHKNLQSNELGAALSVSIIICWFLAFLTYIFADAIGGFYGRSEVAEIFKILGINLLIIPFGTINLALLKRKMMFYQVTVIDVTSAVAGSISVVTFAYLGYSYLSPAYGSLVGCATTVLMSNLYRQKELSWFPSFNGIKKVMSFGSLVSTSNIITNLNSSGPELIIGKLVDTEAVALYNKGFSTAELLNQIVSRSILAAANPYFAKCNRENKVALKKAFLKFQDYMVVIGWPFYIFIAFYAYDVINILYGSQWAYSAILLPYICFNMAAQYPFVLFNQVLLSTGNVKKQLSLVYKITFIKLAIVLYASTHSLELIVIMLMALPFIRLLLIRPMLLEVLDLSFSSLKQKLIKWSSISTCFFAAIYTFHLVFTKYIYDGTFLILYSATFAGIVWICLIFLFKHPISIEVKGFIDKIKTRILG